jgi:hypothetical protein
MKKNILPLLLVITVILIIGLLFIKPLGRDVDSLMGTREKINKTINRSDFSFDKNTPGYDNLTKLSQGCPFKDCIPSIDNPIFESITEADSWMDDDDIVFVLRDGMEARAYSQRILNWHEIVNDEINGNFVAVTFCPLCGSSLAFDRAVEGEVLEFGVSGKLHNNDLVMYDRQSESLWQQITGEAIVGELFGKKLKQIPMDGMRWSDFKSEFTKGKALSRNTGFTRDYNSSPYGSYEKDSSTLFPVQGGIDNTLHPKTIVYGIIVGDETKAYPENKLRDEREVIDTIGDVSVKLRYKDGSVKVDNIDSGEEVIATRLFWFAWKAFNPNTSLY